MEFSYSTILGKITKKIDIAKFLYIHFYKKSYAIVYTLPPSHPRIPNSYGWWHMWHETNKKSRYGGDVRAGALSWV